MSPKSVPPFLLLLPLLSALFWMETPRLFYIANVANALTIPSSSLSPVERVGVWQNKVDVGATTAHGHQHRYGRRTCVSSPSLNRALHSSSSASIPIPDDGVASDQSLTDNDENVEAEKKQTVISKTPSARSITKEVAALGLPALGGMVIDPIMSLVDSSCVGQISTTHLASMAPCTSIYQFLFCVYFFLSATTTNLVAANSKQSESGCPYSEKVLSTATVLAIILGTITSAGLLFFSDPLLTIAGATPELLAPARSYLQIRALSFPAVLVAMVLQGSDLGRQDSITPLKIFSLAGIINLIGDIYLTLWRGMGVRGAAIATAASQFGATAFYAWKAASRRSDKAEVLESNEATKSDTKKKDRRKGVRLHFSGLPSKDLLKEFAVVGMTLLLRAIGCMLFYSLATRTASTFGAASLAAHQLTLQVWWLLAYVPEPMSTAAQSIVARDAKQSSFEVVSKIVRVLVGMSVSAGVLGAGLTALTLSTPSIAKVFVSDPAVRDLMLQTVPFAALAQLACAVCTISDGLCVGIGSFGHLPFSIVSSTALVALGLLGVAKKGLGVGGVWMCFLAFFVLRIGAHAIFSKKLRELVAFRPKPAVE